jgi:hypothetical protein
MILEGSKAPAPGAAPEPTLNRENDAVGTLYGSVGQADVAPTAAQVTAAADAEHELSPLLTRWEEIRKSDLPALNGQLRSANLSEISLESKPRTDETPTDQE